MTKSNLLRSKLRQKQPLKLTKKLRRRLVMLSKRLHSNRKRRKRK